MAKWKKAQGCNRPALIIHNVAGRTLSVGTLCTGDNRRTKSKSSGLRGSPYSLVHALPDDEFNLISTGLVTLMNVGQLTPCKFVELENRSRRLSKDSKCCGTTDLPWGDPRHHLPQSQHQTFPRVPVLQNHRQENLYFIVVRWVPRMKERSGVNLPPLDAPLMATLPGPAYLFLTRNWLPKTGLR